MGPLKRHSWSQGSSLPLRSVSYVMGCLKNPLGLNLEKGPQINHLSARADVSANPLPSRLTGDQDKRSILRTALFVWEQEDSHTDFSVE